ncbi:MAG: hypothetical protein ABSC37_04300 [Xanthobacteraceae bacterium]|jgi:Fe-S cluster assembly ATP-binding protein
MALLNVKNLHVEIDGKEILKGVDLAVNAGEVQKLISVSLEGSVG